MSFSRLQGFKLAGVSTCVPPHRVDNLEAGKEFGAVEVRKVVSMAGVRHRHVVTPDVTAVDLCSDAAQRLLAQLGWAPESVTGLIMVTQSPDYFLPSSSCVVHARLGLGDHCAAFDVGLGCSGYPYGLYLAATMLRGGGHQRILVLHGETPSLFIDPQDQATSLLFGDAGSATALEHTGDEHDEAWFALFTDGRGADSLIIKGGGFRNPRPADPRDLRLRMDGASVFNFTIKRVPALIQDTLAYAGLQVADIDSYIFHQSNRFIMKHLIKKCELPEDRVPFILEDMGNCGGPSVPLTMTRSLAQRGDQTLRLMLLGYGVGLSWGSAVLTLHPGTPLLHHVYQAPVAPSSRSTL
jgi:3-oxoacyl-[acyl-carrier-protein] synthase III